MLKKTLTFLVLFVIFFYNTYSLSNENKILVKIEEDIITSIDVKNEAEYLSLLNQNIKNLKKEEIFNISKKSIIREKVQKIELLKNFKYIKVPDNYLNQILKDIYTKIGIDDLDTFKDYLKKNNIDYNHVKKKIEIEALWNQLIMVKFSSKIMINENEIRKKLKENINTFSKSFLVSEIFFETTSTNEIKILYEKIKKSIEQDGFEKTALT